MRLASIVLSSLLGLAACQEPITFETKGASIDDGFTIPSDVQPGVYKVHIGDDGVAHHEKIADPGPAAAAASNDTGAATDTVQASERRGASAKLGKRQDVFWQISCPDGNKDALDHADTDDALDDLKNQCGGGLDVPDGWHIYATRGNVAAFYCNFQKLTNRCDRATVTQKRKDISKECGNDYAPGWAEWIMFVPGVAWKGLFSYGYHGIGSSKSFCGRNH